MNGRTARMVLSFGLALSPDGVGAQETLAPAASTTDLPVLFEGNFESGQLEGWTFTDPKAWAIAGEPGSRYLTQVRASRYEPKVRSPFNIGLFPLPEVGDFVLDVEVRSTAREYGHRDACVFFGHRDPTRFYYAHLATAADEHAHSIFLVDDQPRISVARERTAGVRWTDGWHHIRVVRDLESGGISIYFDDMTTPVMTATDRRFLRGRVGFGTFDDTADFRRIVLRGHVADVQSDSGSR